MSFSVPMDGVLTSAFHDVYLKHKHSERLINGISQQVLMFQWGLSEYLYLLADGRLLIDTDEDRIPKPINNDQDYWTALVIVARWLNTPQLLDLLPPPPADTPPCSLCDGQHWCWLTSDDGSPRQVLCPGCWGVGWKQTRNCDKP